jgi:hypothetical protein
MDFYEEDDSRFMFLALRT